MRRFKLKLGYLTCNTLIFFLYLYACKNLLPAMWKLDDTFLSVLISRTILNEKKKNLQSEQCNTIEMLAVGL